MITAKGFNGVVEFDGTTVFIQRKLAGTVSLPASSIASVEFKPGGMLVGYVKFHTGAAIDGRKTRNKSEALLRDPHAVTLQWTHNKAFEPLVAAVQEALNAGVSAPVSDVSAQLVSLGELHKAGVLTDEEFQAKKTELLGRM